MNDEWQKIMEQNISEYIATVDFKHPDFSVHQLKTQLKTIIGSDPNVRLKWNTVEKVNELLKDSGVEQHKEIIEKVEEVNLVFMNPDGKPIPLKLII